MMVGVQFHAPNGIFNGGHGQAESSLQELGTGLQEEFFHNTMPYQLLPLLKHHGPVIISLRTLKQPQPQPPLSPPAQPHLHED